MMVRTFPEVIRATRPALFLVWLAFFCQLMKLGTFRQAFLSLNAGFFSKRLIIQRKKAAQWEKKGSDFFKPSKIKEVREIRNSFNRLVNEIHRKRHGYVFYVGTEKQGDAVKHNSTKLYKATLREAIKRIDEFCVSQDAHFILCLDYHSNRAEMVKTSAIEMYGESRRCLIEPLFHAESDLYQTLQFADWIAAVVGKIYAYNTRPNEFSEMEPFKKYFEERIRRASLRSGVRMQRIGNTDMAEKLARALSGK